MTHPDCFLTHVGSLPFKNLENAIDYNLRFDLPVLFTLPQLNKQELMINEVFSLLDLGELDGKRIIWKHESILQSKNVKTPFHFKSLLRSLEDSKKQFFKYQLIGPYSFWTIIKHHSSLKRKDIFEYLSEQYLKILKHLMPWGLRVFALDEPFLSEFEDDISNELYAFVSRLKSELIGIDIYIHCCNKVLADIPVALQNYLQLDYCLYTEENLPNLDEIRFIGIDAKMLKLPIKTIKQRLNNFQNSYITPPCGLGMEKVEKLDPIFMNLVLTKEKLLESGT